MRDLLPQSIDVTWGVLLAAPIFLVFFLSLVIFIYSKNRKKLYEEVEKLPLED
jgi:cbb3-type cytochrome oxidase subunit 3